MIFLSGAVTGMLVLILDGKTAAEGIRQGLRICLQTLVPSLFPFFILSGIITATLVGQTVPCLAAVGKICHIPSGSESLLAVGFLGGYPVGAGMVWSACKDGKLTADEANRMAVICNNAGPSFLFGILSGLFPSMLYVWCLWGIQILASLLTGFLTEGTERTITMDDPGSFRLSDIMNRSIRNMATVCAWVILFRMILEFLDRWLFWLMKPELQVVLTGLLELSNGCLCLQAIPDPGIRFLLATLMLSSGGFCILLQTQSVFPQLRTKQYLAGKMIHLILSIMFSVCMLWFLRGRKFLTVTALTLLVAGIAFLSRKSRNRKLTVAIP